MFAPSVAIVIVTVVFAPMMAVVFVVIVFAPSVVTVIVTVVFAPMMAVVFVVIVFAPSVVTVIVTVVFVPSVVIVIVAVVFVPSVAILVIASSAFVVFDFFAQSAEAFDGSSAIVGLVEVTVSFRLGAIRVAIVIGDCCEPSCDSDNQYEADDQ